MEIYAKYKRWDDAEKASFHTKMYSCHCKQHSEVKIAQSQEDNEIQVWKNSKEKLTSSEVSLSKMKLNHTTKH